MPIIQIGKGKEAIAWDFPPSVTVILSAHGVYCGRVACGKFWRFMLKALHGDELTPVALAVPTAANGFIERVEREIVS